jgi:arginine exporter protein ArgO
MHAAYTYVSFVFLIGLFLPFKSQAVLIINNAEQRTQDSMHTLLCAVQHPFILITAVSNLDLSLSLSY